MHRYFLLRHFSVTGALSFNNCQDTDLVTVFRQRKMFNKQFSIFNFQVKFNS